MIQLLGWGDIAPGGAQVLREIEVNLNALYNLIYHLDIQGYTFVAMNNEGIIIQKKEDEKDFNLINKITVMENNMLNLIKDKEPSQKEVNGFYLLFDMLPEHIKKEIKIYIQNGKNN